MPISELLSSAKRHRKHIKMRLVSAGLLKNTCSACGTTDWQGKQLNMHLDHVNGIANDNRLENLRMFAQIAIAKRQLMAAATPGCDGCKRKGRSP